MSVGLCDWIHLPLASTHAYLPVYCHINILLALANAHCGGGYTGSTGNPNAAIFHGEIWGCTSKKHRTELTPWG